MAKSNSSQESSDEASEDDSDDSEPSGPASDSEGESSAEEATAPKKRKADTDSIPAAKKSKTEATGDTTGQNNLFVGQLSWNVDEDWLAREFGSYGELSSVRVITDKASGRSKGFASQPTLPVSPSTDSLADSDTLSSSTQPTPSRRKRLCMEHLLTIAPSMWTSLLLAPTQELVGLEVIENAPRLTETRGARPAIRCSLQTLHSRLQRT